MKYVALNDELYRYYSSCHTHADDPVLAELRRATEALGDISRMQISPEQGAFLGILAAAIGAQSAIEVGTFTGYSSICIARALPSAGKLICIDASKEWTDIARSFWAKAGVAEKIDLRLGPAIRSLEQLESPLMFDLAFIDADKTEYEAYYELILPRVRRNGLILFDNMLWGGDVAKRPHDQPSGRAIDQLNQKLTKDSRVETVLVPIADGLHICRKF
jgi:caffeoyl-CoA O-methyltransferase